MSSPTAEDVSAHSIYFSALARVFSITTLYFPDLSPGNMVLFTVPIFLSTEMHPVCSRACNVIKKIVIGSSTPYRFFSIKYLNCFTFSLAFFFPLLKLPIIIPVLHKNSIISKFVISCFWRSFSRRASCPRISPGTCSCPFSFLG